MTSRLADMAPEDREHQRAYQAAYYMIHKERILVSRAANRAANPEKFRARGRAYSATEKGRARIARKNQKSNPRRIRIGGMYVGSI